MLNFVPTRISLSLLYIKFKFSPFQTFLLSVYLYFPVSAFYCSFSLIAFCSFLFCILHPSCLLYTSIYIPLRFENNLQFSGRRVEIISVVTGAIAIWRLGQSPTLNATSQLPLVYAVAPPEDGGLYLHFRWLGPCLPRLTPAALSLIHI